MPVTIDKDLCIGCGACVGACPVEALSLDDEGKSTVDEALCIDCHSCIATCPVGAITE
ncbi:MAG: 4Fe-4S binding protein [Solobacterium sp.]|nr:4Fe-4S binding protein [Solobacterium sp.]